MDKVFTSREFVAWLREQARVKRPYWYGTYHNRCTEALLQRKAKQYPGHYGASRMDKYRSQIAAGQICADCVGALKGAVWGELGRREPVYGSHGCPDRSADGMFSYCKSVGMDNGAISGIPEKPGIAVRYSGHIGYYLGGGEVAEWRGFNYGCVITRLKARKWTHWVELPWVEYGEASDTADDAVRDVGTLGSRLLKKGKKGEDVRMLQSLLMELSYALPKHGADGDFGGETEKAVKELQRDNGLEADGIYGEKTHGELMELLSVGDDDEDDVPAASGYIEVTGNTVYVREGAGTQHRILTVVRKGDRLPHIATAANGWHGVQLPDGRSGWISPKYTKEVGTSGPTKAERIENSPACTSAAPAGVGLATAKEV